MADYTKITLGELLFSENETIKRNAVSILKQLQKQMVEMSEEDIVGLGLDKLDEKEEK